MRQKPLNDPKYPGLKGIGSVLRDPWRSYPVVATQCWADQTKTWRWWGSGGWLSQVRANDPKVAKIPTGGSPLD